MNLVRRVVEILVERFVASVGSLFAARIETLAALEHAQQQDELQERARRFEDEGKPHLAAKVRSRAAEILTESPGATGHNVVCQLQQEPAIPGTAFALKSKLVGCKQLAPSLKAWRYR